MSPTELSTILPYLASGARRVSLIKFQNSRVTRQDASRLLTLTREPNSLSLTFQPQSLTRVSILSNFFLCLFLCSFIYSHFVVCGRPRVHPECQNSNLVASKDSSIKRLMYISINNNFPPVKTIVRVSKSSKFTHTKSVYSLKLVVLFCYGHVSRRKPRSLTFQLR